MKSKKRYVYVISTRSGRLSKRIEREIIKHPKTGKKCVRFNNKLYEVKKHGKDWNSRTMYKINI